MPSGSAFEVDDTIWCVVCRMKDYDRGIICDRCGKVLPEDIYLRVLELAKKGNYGAIRNLTKKYVQVPNYK